MSIFKVSGNFHSHPKVHLASCGAIAFWVVAGAWSARNATNGFVPRAAADELMRDGKSLAAELVACGLWRRAEGGWLSLRAVPAVPGGRPVTLWDIERTDYRRKIPKHIRQTVFERDGFRCIGCGATDDLTLDHIYPWSLGGKDTVENLRLLCRSCNSSKGARY